MKYTEDKLISELQRFYDENGRVPVALDMQGKFGYPPFKTYARYFGSFNNAKIKAKLDIIKHQAGTLDGIEICSYCGKRADEIDGFTNWYYDKNHIRYCKKHGQAGLRDYVSGNLDINSEVGLGRVGEILVAKTLEIANEYDCNRISCGYSFDMYHKDYGKIDVKTSRLSYEYARWYFNFPNKPEIKTFVCVGLSSDRKIVEHVWVVPNKGKTINKPSLQINNTCRSLLKYSKWKVDIKPYDIVWQQMIINYRIGKCKIFK